MAKYKHHPDTLVVLNDIKNRLSQLIEVNEKYSEKEPELVKHQNTAFASARMLVQQAIDTGHVFRGSWVVPDALDDYDLATTSVEEQLNKSGSA